MSCYNRVLTISNEAMAQTLVDLAQLILDSAKRIDGVCKERNVTFPSLDEPLTPDSEAIRMDPQVAMSIALITASADQLIATSMAPCADCNGKHHVGKSQLRRKNCFSHHLSIQFHISSAIRVAIGCNVSEALLAAGPQVRDCLICFSISFTLGQGLHVNDIAKGHPVTPEKLGQSLLLSVESFSHPLAPYQPVFCVFWPQSISAVKFHLMFSRSTARCPS